MTSPHKRSWSEQSPARRAGVVAAAAAQLTLLVVALRDLRGRPADQVNGSKAAWTAACFVNFVGPLAYLRFGRRRG